MKIAGGDAKAASAASVALEARRRIDAMFKVDSKFDDMDVCVQLVVAGLVTMIFRV